MVASIAFLAACAGGKDSFNALLAEWKGAWDVRYNFSADECGLASEELTGFVDAQEIVQDGGVVQLESSTGLGVGFDGVIDEQNSFVAEQRISGDLFGDGTQCEVYQSISYEPVAEDEASSFFVRRFNCSDGFSCESRAFGRAIRR